MTKSNGQSPVERLRPVVRVVGDEDKAIAGIPRIALLRGPILSTDRAVNNEAVPAIGLAYVAGYLRRHGVEPLLVDAIAEGLNRLWPVPEFPGYQCQGLTFAETIDRIPADTDIIGVSVMFSGEWPVQRLFLQAIRARFPDALVVIGGEHATALSEFSLRQCPAIDVIVRGEGEHTFFDVAAAWAGDRDYSAIAGVAFLDSDGCYVETTGPTRIRDIDNIPWPYWPEGYLEKFWAAGKSYGVQSERDMPLMVSRGCPFQCTFCSNPAMWTTRYSLRAVDDVIAEMKQAVERYGVTAFQLYDLTAIIKKDWAIELCTKMLAEGINVRWSLPSGTRSEALDEEVLGLLRKTGCNYLVYAPESGSPSTLERIKKKISLAKLTESILTAKKVGLVLRSNLIIGFPGESFADVLRTIRYGLYLAIRGVDEVTINIFSPYPGSELFDDLTKAGRVELSDSYFLALTSLNSDYTRTNPLTFNDSMGPSMLAMCRIGFMLTNYALGYLIFPSRIWRTIRNVALGKGEAATVLEHRLKDLLAKRRGKMDKAT